MKRTGLLTHGACALLLAATGAANAETYGNTDPFEARGLILGDYVLGVQVGIPVDDFKLESFGLMYGHEDYGEAFDSNAIFGLYTSGANGLPEHLVAVTNEIFLEEQQTYDDILFTDTSIVSSGTYWMMALYEVGASPRATHLDEGSVYAYWSNPYENGMPDSAPEVSTQMGADFNYWVNGTIIPAPGVLAALGLLGVLATRGRRVTRVER